MHIKRLTESLDIVLLKFEANCLLVYVQSVQVYSVYHIEIIIQWIIVDDLCLGIHIFCKIYNNMKCLFAD